MMLCDKGYATEICFITFS